MCAEVDVRGNGPLNYVIIYRLRTSMIPFLVDSRNPDCRISLRTGHASTASLAIYHNFWSAEGLQQHIHILGGKRTKQLPDKSNKEDSTEPDRETKSHRTYY